MSKFYRVRVIVDTKYIVKAENEDEAVDKAYNCIAEEGYEPSFHIEEIDEEEYEGE